MQILTYNEHDSLTKNNPWRVDTPLTPINQWFVFFIKLIIQSDYYILVDILNVSVCTLLGINCTEDYRSNFWTLPPVYVKNWPFRGQDWKYLKSVSTNLKYSDTQLLVEVSARKTYFLYYQSWILWTKDQNSNKDSYNLSWDIHLLSFSDLFFS